MSTEANLNRHIGKPSSSAVRSRFVKGKRILSGIQPSGKVHLGNYFGAMKHHIALQDNNRALYFIADYHALTTVQDASVLHNNILDVAKDYLAIGLDPAKTIFFKQSDIPQIFELTWILTTLTPMGLLERCHSYKDKIARGLTPNHGLFAYPVLMAADILAYDAEIVPVGKDQKQHIEVTRDIATKFNLTYRETLVIPNEYTIDNYALVPGIDGQKMSKSYGNTIELFEDEKVLRKKVMRIKTDSTPVEEPKDPSTCSVFALYSLFASEDEKNMMKQRYLEGGMSYKEAKDALFEKIQAEFEPFREKRSALENDISYIKDVLRDGAVRAREIAQNTLDRVRNAVGVSF
ncbi:MAG: tryptophan--tRNA ligase [bacterium]|nr:tryptophan--tRNA ligase [bacterium]